jgi:Lantibiotic biosynthesis dehydratase C-term
MSEPIWRAVYVYHYAEAKDGLILDGIRPLLRRLDRGVERAYFVRHWRRGPHIRIPVLAEPTAFASLVEPAVTDIVGGYLTEHPSAGTLPPEEVLLPAHQRLARLEQDDGPLRPLVPDNTVLFGEHDRRLHTVDGDIGADLLAEFYAGTNHLVFRMLEEVRAGRTREILGLALMLAVAHSFGYPAGIDRGFISFRSHAEAFLNTRDDGDRVREAFERQFRANRATLTRLVTAVLDTLDGRGGEVPFVAEWVDVLRPYWTRSGELVADGRLTIAPDVAADRPVWTGLDSSPMHRMMAASDGFRALFNDPAFKRYRLVLNYTYLHLARLGVLGNRRFLLCHLAANAVEEALGVNAIETVRRFTGTGAGAG